MYWNGSFRYLNSHFYSDNYDSVNYMDQIENCFNGIDIQERTGIPTNIQLGYLFQDGKNLPSIKIFSETNNMIKQLLITENTHICCLDKRTKTNKLDSQQQTSDDLSITRSSIQSISELDLNRNPEKDEDKNKNDKCQDNNDTNNNTEPNIIIESTSDQYNNDFDKENKPTLQTAANRKQYDRVFVILATDSINNTFEMNFFTYNTYVAYKNISREIIKLMPTGIPSPNSSMTSSKVKLFYKMMVEILEKDSKGNFNLVPKDGYFFKIRRNVERMIRIYILSYDSYNSPIIFKNFIEFLISTNESECEPTSLTEVEYQLGQDQCKSFCISGMWPLNSPFLKTLNNVTGSNSIKQFALNISVMTTTFEQPLVFSSVFKIKIYNENEKFWAINRKQHEEDLCILLRNDSLYGADSNSLCFDSIIYNIDRNSSKFSRWLGSNNEHQTDFTSNNQYLNFFNSNISSNMYSNTNMLSADSHSLNHPSSSFGSSKLSSTLKGIVSNRYSNAAGKSDQEQKFGLFLGDENSQNYADNPNSYFEEPNEQIPENIRILWTNEINKWKQSGIKPVKMDDLLKTHSIPKIFRRDVWLLLLFNGGDENNAEYKELSEYFRSTLDRNTDYDKIIHWDSKRTFPSHNLFKDLNGPGQLALVKVCKAYSLYDTEIGYCQGLSFIIGILLLNFSDEEAFIMFVKIMQRGDLRSMFMESFKQLHTDIFTLKSLTFKYLNDLGNHFSDQGIDFHMFAPQWFLTIFTSKFPLTLIYPALEHFFIEGKLGLFELSIGLLKASRKELLQLNFEQILNYFRTDMPRLYLNHVNCSNLLNQTKTFKISRDIIDELALQFETYIHENSEHHIGSDPCYSLRKENRVLFEQIMRLENQNLNLLRDIESVTISNSSISNQAHSYLNRIKLHENSIKELKTEKNELKQEIENLNNELTRERQDRECDSKKSSKIIDDYKNICNRKEQQCTTLEEENRKLCQLIQDTPHDCHICDGSNSVIGNEFKSFTSKTDFDIKRISNIEELEKELIKTKVQLAESYNTISSLEKTINTLENQLNKNWFNKIGLNSKK